MKKPILFALFLLLGYPALAQYEYLAVAGINALKGHPQKPDEYVTQASYQGRTFPQKRTPAGKVPGKGGPQITAVEQQLSACYATLQADATGPVLGSGREATLTAALSALQTARPQWSTSAYAAELDFYRSEDSRRQYVRDEQARKVAYQRQQREQARRDSLGRVAQRRAFLIDSTRQVVQAEQQARQDSVAQARATARQALEDEATRLEAEEARAAASPARPSTAPKSAVRKVVVKTKRSTGPTVYYCASGNTVKYHATSGCRGLARCGASILPISLRDAQQQMDPCKWCY